MTSNINPFAINTNVPVANSDNPSQDLRNNFAAISAQFTVAAQEISSIQGIKVKLDGPVESNAVVLTSDPNGTLVVTRIKPTDLEYAFEVPGTGAIRVPIGSTSQRPSSSPLAPAKGMIRYNTDTEIDSLEYYNGHNWITVGGGIPGPQGEPGPPGPSGSGSTVTNPGGPDRSIQFNNSGVFDGNSNLTWDGSQLVTSKLQVDQVSINNDTITNILSSGILRLNAKGQVDNIQVRNNGGGYTSIPAITIDPPAVGGVQATATAQMGAVMAAAYNRGVGYIQGDVLSVSGGVAMTPTILTVDSVRIGTAQVDPDNRGVGYKPNDVLNVVGGNGPYPATLIVTRVRLRDPVIVGAGRGYTTGDLITVFGGSYVQPTTCTLSAEPITIPTWDQQLPSITGLDYDLNYYAPPSVYNSVKVYVNASLKTYLTDYTLSTVGSKTRVSFLVSQGLGRLITVRLNSFVGNGVSTIFGLSGVVPVSEAEELHVSVDNVKKTYLDDYILADAGSFTEVVFYTAPDTGRVVRAALGGRVTSVTLDQAGSYRDLPNLVANTAAGGSGQGLLVEFNTEVDEVLLQNKGPYDVLPPLDNNKATGGSGFGAYFDLTSEINTLRVSDAGNYSFLPPLIENAVTGGSGTDATVNLSYGVVGVNVDSSGSLYENSPTVSVDPSPSGNNARLSAVMTGGKVTIGDLVVTGSALGTAPVVTNVIYVTLDGDDSNDGLSEDRAKRSIKAACAVAKSYTTIFVRAGNYTEQNPIYVPERVSIIGDNLRRVNLFYANPTKDFFWVNNAVYIAGVSFRGGFAPGYAISFPALSSPDLPPGVSGGAGFITTSPYVQNCTCFNNTGGGMLVDGNLAKGLKSMVLDAFTQFNQGGPGIHIRNQGYAQLVSIFTICTNIGTWVESGGTCSISNSNTSFGDIGILADGISPYLFGGKIKTGTGRYRVDNITVNAIDKRPYVGLVATIGNEFNYVETIDVIDQGQGYTSQPIVFVDPPEGYSFSQATVSAVVVDGQIDSIVVNDSGSGYTGQAYVTIYDPSGVAPPSTTVVYRAQDFDITSSGAGYSPGDLIYVEGGIYPNFSVDEPVIFTVTTVGDLGQVTGVIFNSTGNYSELPIVSGAATSTTGNGKGFSCNLNFGIYQILMDPGGEFFTTPIVTITGGGGITARATADWDSTTGTISSISMINQGSGYLAKPQVVIQGGGGVGATAVTDVTNGVVTSVRVTNPGVNFSTIPAITFVGGGGSGATVGLINFKVVYVTINNSGTGYLVNDILTVVGGTGQSAQFRVKGIDAYGSVKSLEIDYPGSYTIMPSVVAAPTVVTSSGGSDCLINLSLGIDVISLSSGGSSYQSGPQVRVLGGGAESKSFTQGKLYTETSYLVPDNDTVTNQALTYAKTLTEQIVAGTPITGLYQTAVTQVIDPALSASGSLLTQVVSGTDTFYEIVKSFIDPVYPNGYSEFPFDNAAILMELNKSFLQAEAIAFVAVTYPLFVYNQDLCYRDVGLIVDALSMDVRSGGYIRSLRAGNSYWNGAVRYIDGEVTETLATLEYLRTLCLSIVTNTTITSPMQQAVSQIKDISRTGGSRAQDNITTAFGIMTYIINNGVDLTGFENASRLIQANKNFLQAEVLAYVEVNDPGVFYSVSREKFASDIGNVAEAVAIDLVGGGGVQAQTRSNLYPKYYTVSSSTPLVGTGTTILPASNDTESLSYQAGKAYYDGASLVIPAPEVAPTIAAIDYAKAWALRLIQNIITPPPSYPSSPYQNSVTPVSSVLFIQGAIAAATTTALFNNVSRFINSGTSMTVYQDAVNVLSTNKTSLQNQVKNYVIANYPTLLTPSQLDLCIRDVGYIIDAIANDIRTGGISKSLQAGRAYWDGVVRLIPSIPTDTVGPTIDAIDFLVSKMTPLLAPYSASVGETFTTCVYVIKQIITDGAALTGFNDASQLLRLNKEFLQAEVFAYVQSTYPGLMTVTQQAFCFRDVGYIVDAVAGDLVGAGLQPIGYTQNQEATIIFEEATDYAPLDNDVVNFYQVSVASSSSHTFEYVGAGTDINTCLPQLGGVPVQDKEVVMQRGGRVYYTSTDHKGDFRIGEGLVINQNTGTLSGRVFAKSLFGIITPFVLSIESAG